LRDESIEDVPDACAFARQFGLRRACLEVEINRFDSLFVELGPVTETREQRVMPPSFRCGPGSSCGVGIYTANELRGTQRM